MASADGISVRGEGSGRLLLRLEVPFQNRYPGGDAGDIRFPAARGLAGQKTNPTSSSSSTFCKQALRLSSCFEH